jgi:hypothetical protein
MGDQILYCGRWIIARRIVFQSPLMSENQGPSFGISKTSFSIYSPLKISFFSGLNVIIWLLSLFTIFPDDFLSPLNIQGLKRKKIKFKNETWIAKITRAKYIDKLEL